MLPYLALTLAMLLWASSFIALKYVFAVFDPVFVLFARMVIASLCVLPLILRAGKRWRYQTGDWKWLLGLGLAEPCLYFLFEAKALMLTSASQAAVITATLPILVTAGAMLFLAERHGRQVWAGMVVSFAGVVWLTVGASSSADAPNPLLGNALEFLAMVCGAGYMLIAKKLSPRYSALLLTGVQALMGSLWFGIGMLTPWGQWPDTLPLWPSVWVVYLGACITLGGYGLYTWAVSKVDVARAASFINLIPVFSVALAWLILGEMLNLSQWLACALVFGGVLVSQKKPQTAMRMPVPAKS
ncbi:DMT family transporter [Craterilacuibacter sinensis]|uniref:EamA family transporter n=1 Tax=Craterilacuibacter sinensis TaxID=2686017 RepID=A0A845BXR0_9NEIS|nr:DMT family transporter [Craterilacuibacter sinensis]MXR37293.1 EamA family transporter [Craterilacuibacter sinensis]